MMVVIFSVFITIAAAGHYESSVGYQHGDDYYPLFTYVWYAMALPIIPLQFMVIGEHASITYWVVYLYFGITTFAYSYTVSCILAYAAIRGRNGLKTYYDI